MSERIQCNRILRLLREYEGRWVPLYEILSLHIASHTRRIFELRQEGYNIEKEEERGTGVHCHERRVSYRLIERKL